MQKKSSNFSYFIILLIISLLIFGLSTLGFFKPVEPIFRTILSPVQATVYGGFSFITGIFSNSKLKDLQNENRNLTKKLIEQDKLIEDNKALRDQFETENPKSNILLPAQVVGAPGFIPGVSLPENYTLDKGESDGVKEGDAVIFEDNLVGVVSKTTRFLSSVELITNSSFTLTAKTLETNALGVVKGQGGGELILDNVVLSDTLKKGDIVLSKGDVEVGISGTIPNLIVGKITAVNKNPSDLFQKAKIKSNVDFSKVNKVFIITSL